VTFVDTSALLAFLDRDAAAHEPVVASLATILGERRGVTHNYVVVEAGRSRTGASAGRSRDGCCRM
jgi:predicted nucleic acid-binding protein